MPKAQILVVEDEVVIAEDIGARLQKAGYEVRFAANGDMAIAIAAQIKPSLVLMDIHLRGQTDGIMAAERIREHHSIPVVYLSGHAEGETFERAKISEPFGYILKPVDSRELEIAIEIALYKHKMERQREQLIAELRDALAKVKTLKGLLPICCYCKKIKDDKGYWDQVEAYVADHSDAKFSHGMCPECFSRIKGELDALEGGQPVEGAIFAGH